MWNTQRDKKVRPSHRAMDGQIVNQLGYFTFSDGTKVDRPAGDSQAGTTVTGANVVRCRCYLFPIEQPKNNNYWNYYTEQEALELGLSL